MTLEEFFNEIASDSPGEARRLIDLAYLLNKPQHTPPINHATAVGGIACICGAVFATKTEIIDHWIRSHGVDGDPNWRAC